MFIPLEHKIKRGDTLSEIAQMYNTSVEYLAKLNNIKDINKIKAGDTLKLFDFEKGSPTPITGRPFGEPLLLSPDGESSLRKKIEESPGVGIAALSDPDDPTKINPELLEFFAGLNPFKDKESTTQDKKEESKQTNLRKSIEDSPGVGLAALGDPDDPTKLSPEIINFLERGGQRPKKSEKKASRATKKINSDAFLPINVRQFFRPEKDRTEKDLSKAELDTLKEVIEYSQRPEVREAKIKRGINPDTIRYSDYNALGAQNFAQRGASGSLIEKVSDPINVLKSFLGQATLTPADDGGFIVKDVFDFEPSTQATGLAKLGEYLQSVRDIGASDAYGQLRNFMGFFGPQEGTGAGGRSTIKVMKGGGDTMDIKQQTKNVAAQGRFGDSMLLHVNPAEVKGLAQAMPITVNPQTGQPEAFLPFLAPIFGSMLGGSLLAGKTIAGLTLSKAAAAGIGAGLAQTAATGDIKEGIKSGLLSGLTARAFGSGAEEAIKKAGEAEKITNLENATTKALLEQPEFVTKGTGINFEPYGPVMTGPAGTLNELGQNELLKQMADFQPSITKAGADAVATYSGNIPGTGAATFGEDFSTLFDDGIGQGFKNIGTGLMSDPVSLGGLATVGGVYATDMMQQQFEEQQRRMEQERLERKRQNELMNPEPILFNRGGSIRRQIAAAADEIDSPELPQIFAPAKQAYAVNPDFMPGFAPETMYFNPATISPPAGGLTTDGPPTVTDTYEGSKGGYGGRQASIAPQVSIDPFSAYTGQAPAGLQFTEPQQSFPIDPFPQPIVPPILPPDFDIGPIGGIPGLASNMDFYNPVSMSGVNERMIGAMNERAFPTTGVNLGLPMGTQTPMPVPEMMGDGSTLANLTPMPNLLNQPAMMPEPMLEQDMLMFQPPIRTRSEGGDTVDRADLPEGLKAMYDSGPKGREGVEKIAAKTDKFQEGGMTEIMNDPLTKEVTAFLLGESNDERAINMFLSKYGNEAFLQLREAVLQSVVPGAQTQGLIRGEGKGGMDDDLMGRIGNKERIAVSQDEFIVPADVVSMLGDGSSDAGSEKLYDMMDRVRQEKTGTTKQAPKLANVGGLLPA